MVTAGHMPGGRKAPAHASPKGMPAEKVVAEIGPKVAAMDAVIAECEIRYGRGVRLLDHPVLGPLTGAQWRKFHWVHGRHHVKQILRIREGRNSSGLRNSTDNDLGLSFRAEREICFLLLLENSRFLVAPPHRNDNSFVQDDNGLSFVKVET